MIEKRAAPRTRTFISARLLFGARALTAECDIRDLSTHGAKLLVDEEIPVPTEFILEIPSKHREHKAHLVWRHGDGCGVVFEDETLPIPQDADPSARIRALEDENAILRRQLRQLRAELAMRTQISESAI